MTRPPLIPVVVLLLSVGACTTRPPVDVPRDPATVCVADDASWAIGRAATAEVVERARVDSHSNDVRVIEPGQAVTMDFRSDRLTVSYDDDYVIGRISCG